MYMFFIFIFKYPEIKFVGNFNWNELNIFYTLYQLAVQLFRLPNWPYFDVGLEKAESQLRLGKVGFKFTR